jgi:hypothetical protein
LKSHQKKFENTTEALSFIKKKKKYNLGVIETNPDRPGAKERLLIADFRWVDFSTKPPDHPPSTMRNWNQKNNSKHTTDTSRGSKEPNRNPTTGRLAQCQQASRQHRIQAPAQNNNSTG